MVSYFFDKSKPVNFLVISALFLVYLVLISVQEFDNFESFGSFSLFISKVVGFFFVLFLLFNFIVSKNKLTLNNTYAFLFFVLLIGLFPSVIKANLHVGITITLLFLLRKVYSLKSGKAFFKKLFDAGFLMGISFIIEPFSMLFFLLIYAAIVLHKKESIQTLLIPVIGFVVPLLLFGTYCYWNDTMIQFKQLFYWTFSFDFTLYRTLHYVTPFFLIGFFTVLSIIIKTPKAFSVSNSFKKNWVLLMINLLIAIGLLLFLKERDGSELLLVFFPIAIILGNGIEMIEKRWLKELILWSFLMCSFIKTTFMVFI